MGNRFSRQRSCFPDLATHEQEIRALGDNAKWLVTRVNNVPVTAPTEFYKAVKGQNSVKLTVIDPTETPRREREVTLP